MWPRKKIPIIGPTTNSRYRSTKAAPGTADCHEPSTVKRVTLVGSSQLFSDRKAPPIDYYVKIDNSNFLPGSPDLDIRLGQRLPPP